MNIALVYDELNSQVQGQIVQDLIALQNYNPIVSTKDIELFSLLEALNVPHSDNVADLTVVYCVRAWPTPMPKGNVVKRDLRVKEYKGRIDTKPQNGYPLKEQGRPRSNLTQQYLNRNAPRGKGIANPFLVNLL